MGTNSVVQWSVCSEDLACTHSKSREGITQLVSCWLWSGCIFKLSFWVVERMTSLFILFVFTIYYFATQCQAQESSDWMSATDHYEICWQKETFAAAANLSCHCHLISNLTGARSWTSQKQVQSSLLLLIPVSYPLCTIILLHPPLCSW